MASSEAKTKPGSEATKRLGSVSKRSCSHEEQSTESPVSKLRHDGMRHANKTTAKALHCSYCSGNVLLHNVSALWEANVESVIGLCFYRYVGQAKNLVIWG